MAYINDILIYLHLNGIIVLTKFLNKLSLANDTAKVALEYAYRNLSEYIIILNCFPKQIIFELYF